MNDLSNVQQESGGVCTYLQLQLYYRLLSSISLLTSSPKTTPHMLFFLLLEDFRNRHSCHCHLARRCVGWPWFLFPLNLCLLIHSTTSRTGRFCTPATSPTSFDTRVGYFVSLLSLRDHHDATKATDTSSLQVSPTDQARSFCQISTPCHDCFLPFFV